MRTNESLNRGEFYNPKIVMAIKLNQKFIRIIIGLLFTVGIVFQANSETYIEKVNVLIKTHKRILAAKDTVKSVEEQLSIARKAWFPELSSTAFYGYEKRNLTPGNRNTSMPPHEVDLTITQPILDFGSKSSALEIAKLQLRQSKLVLDATLQEILLEAISAQVNLISGIEIERYAKRSVSNIKQQAKLEDARVSIGSGFSTDVLQAKAQLAGAEARYTLSKGARRSSENRYRSVFGSIPERNQELEQLAIPVDRLPTSIDVAVSRSLKNNAQIKALTVARDTARAAVKQTRAAEFSPTVNLILDTKYKHNVLGLSGNQIEHLIKGELKYTFNLGATSFNNVAAVKAGYFASVNRLMDAQNLIEEQARNAYHQLNITQRNAQFLRNQANISGEFLRLARKERQLGRRSLLDVLSGETVEINASSDASNAENQVIVAAYTMLFVMGDLKVEDIKLKITNN